MANEFNLRQYLKDSAQAVNEAMEGFLPEKGEYMGNLGEVMRYAVFPGGKRFRPIVAMACAQALGKDPAITLPVGCAFELIHCFSLVHDDLPCMDNDVERRGKPTCHVAYGEDTALLAGDALSIYAFHVACANADQFADPFTAVRLVRELACAGGYPGMVGGQILDMEAQHHGTDKERLLAVHKAKTGALIRGAARCGAICAGATEEELQAITKYSELVGLVFQITDDILDAVDDPDPISFPSIYGMEESKRMAREATDEAIRQIERFGENAAPLRALAEYLLVRTV